MRTALRKIRFSGFEVAALAIALLISIPLLTVALALLLAGPSDTWRHLAGTVLPDYLLNTLVLSLGVSVGTVILGASTAWLVCLHDFPGRRLFEWALVLPLAVPAYVMAYTYTDLLQFVGPVQTWLRETFDLKRGQYWFPEVRSLNGAVFIFSFVFYPYVYLLARTAFLERAPALMEIGCSLGLDGWQRFVRIALPLARPAIAAGASLALMETLADYGAVSYFGVQTFTTGIYRAWFSLGDRVAAAQLSASLLGAVGLVMVVERITRGRARFHDRNACCIPAPGRKLNGVKALGAVLACMLPIAIGFLLPAGSLLHMAILDGDAQLGERFLRLARNSFLLASLAAGFAVAFALLLAYAARTSRYAAPAIANRVVALGYSLPGTVIAVGVLIPVTQLDTWIAQGISELTGWNPGLLLTGGIAALLYAYLVRFLAISLQTVEANLAKITSSMDDAARSLGCADADTLWWVHIPMLRGSLMTAGLLVFVEVMKELPATLVMRPFNFDTLATQAYILASDERLNEAASAALAIVAVGIPPLILLSREISRSRQGG